jgi:hypothetical protein
MTPRKLCASLVATVTIACAAGAVPALAGVPVATTITAFSWTDNDNGTDYFDGSINATEPKCVKHRKVIFYRKQSGDDQRVAATETDRDGAYKVEREDPGSGKYYVKVKRHRAGEVSCKRAQSGSLQVTDLEGV